MRGEFKLPTKLPGKPVKNSQKVVIDNDVYSSPYEIRVRPPSTFVAPAAGQQKQNDSNDAEPVVSDSVPSNEEASSSKLTILRIGRSIQKNPDNEPLTLLSEQDAEQLSRFVD